MTAAFDLKTTASEYLEYERGASEKHEFLEGFIYAMAGATLSHDRISRNLSYLLTGALKDRPCENFTSDVRISADEDSAYFYPDASGLCGPPLLGDDNRDTLLNPSFIAEVLSESTEGYDRGKKFANYRKIETFEDYLLISQWEVSVELFRRQSDGSWRMDAFTNRDDIIPIASLDCELLLGDLYKKVEFEERTDGDPSRRERA